MLTAARERRVWRVEASAGRLAGVGVYDIGAVPHDDIGAVPHDHIGAVAHDDIGAVPHDDLGAVPHDDVDAGQHQWRLLRVAD